MKTTLKKILVAVLTLALVATTFTVVPQGLQAAEPESPDVAVEQQAAPVDKVEAEAEQPQQQPAEEAKTPEKASGDVSYEAEVKDQVKVEAVAKKGTFEGDVELNAEVLDKTEKKEAQQLMEEQEVQFEGFLPINLSFMNGNSEQEPDGTVGFSMEINKELIGENADPDSLKLVHYEEDASTGEVKEIVEVKDANIDVKKDIVALDFEVDSLSTFALTWNNRTNNPMTIHVVNQSGQELSVTTQDKKISDQTDPSTLAPAVQGYAFDYAAYIPSGKSGISNGVKFTSLTRSSGVWYGYVNNSWKELPSNDSGTTVYFVYKKTATEQPMNLPANGSGKIGDVEDKDIGAPEANKTLTANKGTGTPNDFSEGDGTYNLALSVKGKTDQETVATMADVVIIFDRSSSMERESSEYHRDHKTYTNFVIAQKETKELIKTLLQNNTDQHPDAVQVGLITFDATATVLNSGNLSYSQNALNSMVDGIQTGFGTDWEAALRGLQSIKFRQDSKKYVIFITDGYPTAHINDCHSTEYSDKNCASRDVYYSHPFGGAYTINVSESNPNGLHCYNMAKDEAEAIKKVGYDFYGISVFRDPAVERVWDITEIADKRSNAFSVNSSDDLAAAFQNIIKDVSASFSYKNVTITDGLTSLPADGYISHFTYYKDGEVWEDAPAATYDEENRTITWPLGENYKLDPVEYRVECTVWPSQRAYDIATALKNGDITKGQTNKEVAGKVVTAEEWAELEVADNKDAKLKTNTHAEVTYNKIKVDESGTETPMGNGTVTLPDPDPMPLHVEKIKVKKIWDDNNKTDKRPQSVDLKVKQDGNAFKTFTLNAENNWQAETWISTGLRVKAGDYGSNSDGNNAGILERGHEYTIAEEDIPAGYELTTTNSVWPLLNGLTTKNVNDVLDKSGDAIANDFALSATNRRIEPAKVDLQATKSLTGREWSDNDSFTFQLKDSNGNVLKEKTATKNAKTVTFTSGEVDELTFNETGTYTFTIAEDTTKNPASVSMVEGPVTATVTVTEGTDNNLQASVEYKVGNETSNVIKNKYEASVPVEIGMSKAMTGRTWKQGDAFTFQLKKGDDVLDEKTATFANQTVQFDAITYHEDQLGVHNYQIVEKGNVQTQGFEKPDPIDVKVTVTDPNKNGTLSASVKYSSNGSAISTLTNSYDATGDATIHVKKQLKGRDWNNGETFTFELRDEANNRVGQPVTVSEQKPEADFAKITYTKKDGTDETGQHNYTIVETTNPMPEGVVSSGPIAVTVDVTDNGKGQLTTDVEYNPESDTIVNTYYHGGTVLHATKVLNGREWKDGEEFTFQLKKGNDVIDTKKATKNAPTVNFKELKYSNADIGKTFNYTIHETDPADTTLESSGDIAVEVTVTSAEDGKGTLIATPVYKVNNKEITDPVITNTYGAEGSAQLEATKILTGREWKDEEEFTFQLSGDGITTPQTKKVSKAEPKAVFDEIEYTQEDAGKTFNYTIDEIGTLPPGVSKSGVITATVTVVDNGDKTLTATPVYKINNKVVTNPTITNTYTAYGNVILSATKVLSGRDWKDGETFTFQLQKEDGTPVGQAKTVSEEKPTAEFGPIDYQLSDVGTHKYKIVETDNLTGTGLSKSGDVEVTVKVTDNGDGTLKVEPKYTDNRQTITNTYAKDGSIKLHATKVLNGRNWKDSDAFTFQLKDSEGNVLDTQTATSTKKTVEFKELTYGLDRANNKNDLGSYTYTITEKTDNLPPGVTKASGDITVDVEVSDSEDSDKLVVTAQYVGNNDTIVNTYKSSTATFTPAGTKVMKKGNQTVTLQGGEYTFKMVEVDSADLETAKKKAGTVDKTVTNQAGGAFSFDTITYTYDPANNVNDIGTYYYKISEVIPEGAEKTEDGKYVLNGITYDGHSEIITVEVKKDASDSLAATPNKQSTEITFNNTYTAKASAQFEATKKLMGREWKEGEEFTFQLSGEGITTQTKKVSKAEPKAVFDKINYTVNDLGVHNYKIEETDNLTGKGITKSADINVKVTVSDNGNGTLTVVTEYKEGTKVVEKPVITNTYAAEGATDINVYKKLTGREFKAGDKWTFKVEAKTAGAPMPEVTQKTVEPTSGNVSDKVTFGDFNFTEANAGKTYEYVVSEVNTGDESIVYDGTSKTVKIKVADKGNGTLDIQKEGEPEGGIEFVNKYFDTNAVIEGTKTFEYVEGGEVEDWTDWAEFEFGLYNKAGDKEITFADNKPCRGKTDKDGKFQITTPKYNKEGVHEYSVKEILPAEATEENNYTVNGIKYSTEKINVTVTVSRGADGKLKATVDKSAAQVSFDNKYEATGKIQFSGEKILLNRDEPVKENEFTFRLVRVEKADAEAAEIGQPETVKNDAEGKFSFNEITYKKAGTYYYKVNEVKPTGDKINPWITYDETPQFITVTVTDDRKGNLTATADKGVTSPVSFTNRYHTNKLVLTKTFDEEKCATKLTDEQKEKITFHVTGPKSFDQTVSYADFDANGKYVFTELEPGKYNVEEENQVIVGYICKTTYTVDANPAGNGDVVFDESRSDEHSVAITNKYSEFVDFSIVKTLIEYELQKDFQEVEGLEFAFLLDAEYKEMGYKYSNVYAANFAKGGTQEIKVDKIPVGATVTVTEINSGATYSVTTESPQTQTKVIEIGTKQQMQFINQYDGKNKREHGALNTFTKGDNGWSGERKDGQIK